MKGLLVKDYKTLFNQNKSFLFLFVIAVIIVFTMKDGLFFLTGYGAMIATIFTTNTISYDTLDNGYTFMFTLPVTRKQYVLEKYLVGIIMLVICSIYTFILGLMKTQDLVLGMSQFTMIGIGMVMMSIMVPLVIRFGVEKLRIVLFVIAGGVVGIVAIAKIILEQMNMNVTELTATTADSVSPVLLIVIAVVVVLGLFAGSILYSISAMEKKEF